MNLKLQVQQRSPSPSRPIKKDNAEDARRKRRPPNDEGKQKGKQRQVGKGKEGDERVKLFL